jgi:hypothetical protein
MQQVSLDEMAVGQVAEIFLGNIDRQAEIDANNFPSGARHDFHKTPRPASGIEHEFSLQSFRLCTGTDNESRFGGPARNCVKLRPPPTLPFKSKSGCIGFTRHEAWNAIFDWELQLAVRAMEFPGRNLLFRLFGTLQGEVPFALRTD